MIQLDNREQAILAHILEIDSSITGKELADKFNVSLRSVKYDLDNIRDWLKEQNCQLFSKRSKGYWLEISEKQRQSLKKALSKSAAVAPLPVQDNRVKSLIFRLLQSNGYVSTQEIADWLEVSKNTITSDLEEATAMLAKYNVTLEKRSGYGLSIGGVEKNRRNVLEVLLQNELSEYDIYQIMNRLVSEEKPLSDSIYFSKESTFFSIFKNVIETLANLLKNLTFNQLNYAELLSLSFRVTIATSRMLLNQTIGSYKMLANQNRLSERNDLTFQLMKEVFQLYELPLLEDEYSYLFSDAFEFNNQQDIVQITKEIIDAVSKKLKISFASDPQLFTNLFAHLSLRLGKKRVFVNEYNPFIEDIKRMHPELFEAIEEACKEIITSAPNLVNESFVAYIALHFLVFFEREQKEKQFVRAVYICSTGLGVTSLIKQTIMEEIPNIEVVDFASVLNAEDIIKEKKPDLVISIFPMEDIGVPFVKVHALPTKEDIQTIKTIIKGMASETIAVQKKQKISKRGNFKELKETSLDLIVKGFVIYQKLMSLFYDELIDEFKDAFLLHVFLMVHRIYFDEQYKDEGYISKEDFYSYGKYVEHIEKVFIENELSVSQAEIIALLQYIQKR
ncbi:transcriptional antiterminator [Enterococcus sp. PF1-24]|uniref:BglG family transcription antiterminator n=1 Tax=unclassified Enterococcus TaxID=2608891 RepID=UPI0024768A14|nr:MULTISPECIES: transcription antiterminator [unclassified Enterococcus]MDH6363218.1 transcriptional antiterminator [Enterococcus sp. PFB1-1]MDH6400481.1 transcriptional antiterminator [Enterococcus sp. PF1-24]